MTGPVLILQITLPPVRHREVLRYMGADPDDTSLYPLVERAAALCEGSLSCRVCYRELEMTEEPLARWLKESDTVRRALADCEGGVLFAATVGLTLDRLVLTYSRTEPSLALCLQAYGAERIEALCDAFCRAYATEVGACRPRISPGYGDFPLEEQRQILPLLDCPRKLGLTLNESLLMSPTKSVTALFGRKEVRK